MIFKSLYKKDKLCNQLDNCPNMLCTCFAPKANILATWARLTVTTYQISTFIEQSRTFERLKPLAVDRFYLVHGIIRLEVVLVLE